jgi:hypothetical protein
MTTATASFALQALPADYRFKLVVYPNSVHLKLLRQEGLFKRWIELASTCAWLESCHPRDYSSVCTHIVAASRRMWMEYLDRDNASSQAQELAVKLINTFGVEVEVKER